LDFSLSEKQEHWLRRVREFMDSRIYPAVTAVRDEFAAMGANRWQPSRKIEELKAQAKREGLWNLFLPPSSEHDSAEYLGAGLTNLEYALCAQEMGRVPGRRKCSIARRLTPEIWK